MSLNKGLHVNGYNSLNLPAWIEVNSPVAEAIVNYNYTATGEKIMAYHMYNMNRALNPVTGATVENITGYPVRDELLTSRLVTSYVGNKVYENGNLKRVLVDGGYIENGVYHYYVTDHLGNNRIVANSSGTVMQSTQYYLFGMSFADASGTSTQPYKYNGKELDQMHSLNLYESAFVNHASGFGIPQVRDSIHFQAELRHGFTGLDTPHHRAKTVLFSLIFLQIE
jgi:hypothetical protein